MTQSKEGGLWYTRKVVFMKATGPITKHFPVGRSFPTVDCIQDTGKTTKWMGREPSKKMEIFTKAGLATTKRTDME